MNGSRIVALLSKVCAKERYTFQFLENNVCKACEHRKPCVGRLRDKRVYGFVGIKDREAGVWCPLVNDRLIAVYLTSATVRATIPKRGAIEGAKITYIGVDCDVPCENRVLCKPLGLFDQDKAVVEEVGEAVPCPLHQELVEASLAPIFE